MNKKTREEAYENARRVWKIMEDAVAYGFNSSHSLSVAYDSLYGAYLKANYPLEYFSVVLNIYQDDVEMTAQLLKELDSFDIKLINPVFGKAQSEYSFVKDTREVVKGLKSIKFMNNQTAEALFELSKNKYNNFVYLLKDITEKSPVNNRQLGILIKLDFFEEFGNSKYLYNVFEFFNSRFKRTHKNETKEKRMQEVIDYSNENKDVKDFSINEKVLFQRSMLGYALTFNDTYKKSLGVVVDINTKYAPMVSVYSIKSGKEVNLKVNKKLFFGENKEHNMKVGDLIDIQSLENKPKLRMQDGEWIKTDVMQLWVSKWELLKRIEE